MENIKNNKKDYPLVSLIITTFNREELISRAIQSALNQTYPNIEIIVVDDGSTDNTHQRVNSFIKQYSTVIKYVYQANQGRSAARNHGISLIKGDYVSFLDDDDELLPSFYESLVPLLKNNSSLDIVFSGCYKQENGQRTLFTNFEDLNSEKILNRFIGGNFVPNMCFLLRASKVSTEKFPVGEYLNEDWYFIMKLMNKNNTSFINEPLAVYHFHGKNTSTKYLLQMGIAELEMLSRISHKFCANKEITRRITKVSSRKYKHLSRRLRKNKATTELKQAIAIAQMFETANFSLKLRLLRDKILTLFLK